MFYVDFEYILQHKSLKIYTTKVSETYIFVFLKSACFIWNSCFIGWNTYFADQIFYIQAEQILTLPEEANDILTLPEEASWKNFRITTR